MKDVAMIIFYNKMIDEYKAEGNVQRAAKAIMKLRKMEIKDKVEIGSYRIGRKTNEESFQ